MNVFLSPLTSGLFNIYIYRLIPFKDLRLLGLVASIDPDRDGVKARLVAVLASFAQGGGNEMRKTTPRGFGGSSTT